MSEIKMNGLNNRLEIIKNLIAIGELEEVELQAKKLKVFGDVPEINKITGLLIEKEFHLALTNIDSFLKKNKRIVPVDEAEAISLKLEVMSLEKQMAELEEEKASMESKINEFQIKYQKILGDLTEELLRLKKDKLAEESTKDNSKASDYKTAESDYNEYQEAMSGMANKVHKELDAEDQEKLKKAFRKACKLCHPDVVYAENQEKAQSIFIDLRNAYGENDLKRVQEILDHLENGKPLREAIERNTKKALMAEKDRLRVRIFAIEKEIEKLKNGDVFKMIIGIHNWDAFFSDRKAELVRKIDSIKGRNNVRV